MNETLPPLKQFILPSGDPLPITLLSITPLTGGLAASQLHVARSVSHLYWGSLLRLFLRSVDVPREASFPWSLREMLMLEL